MWTGSFWKAAAERAVSTGAQVLVTLAGTDALGWVALDWGQIGVASLIASGLSVAKSLIVSGGGTGSPSAINAEVVTGEPRKP